MFTASAAWLTLVVVTYTLATRTANAADLGRVTTETLRLAIIAMPARLVSSARRWRLRMPTSWPWATTSPAPSKLGGSNPRPADPSGSTY